jgi:hypothetical protein
VDTAFPLERANLWPPFDTAATLPTGRREGSDVTDTDRNEGGDVTHTCNGTVVMGWHDRHLCGVSSTAHVGAGCGVFWPEPSGSGPGAVASPFAIHTDPAQTAGGGDNVTHGFDLLAFAPVIWGEGRWFARVLNHPAFGWHVVPRGTTWYHLQSTRPSGLRVYKHVAAALRCPPRCAVAVC